MRSSTRRPKASLFQLVQEAENLHARLTGYKGNKNGKLQRIIQRSRARYLRRVERLTKSPVWERMSQYRKTARQRFNP